MKHLRTIRLAAVLLSALLFSACQQSSAAPLSDFCSRLEAVCFALNGTPYVWGGKSASGLPAIASHTQGHSSFYRIAQARRAGFDCSGAIYYVAGQLGQPVPRTTSKKYFVTTPGESVHWQFASCGYLSWWQFSQARPYGHVGIMVQDFSFWQAGSSTGFVQRRFETGKFWDQKFQGSKKFFK